MRIPISFRWLAGVLAVGLGLLWLRERAVVGEGETRNAALAREQQRLARLEKEREHVREELAGTLVKAGAEPVASVARADELPARPGLWRAGEWTAASAWRNAGRATPQAAISTLLWAATSGDLATLRGALYFDDANRAKARAWFESLPPAGRLLYGTPEELVAGATLYKVSPTHAQVSWLHQADDDHAIVGMLLAEPTSAEPSSLVYQPSDGQRPPGLVGRSAYRVIVLDLHRAADGWRIKVPATAIDSLAQQLRTSGPN